MCLSWDYPILAKMPAIAANNLLVEPIVRKQNKINFFRAYGSVTKHLYQEHIDCSSYSNKIVSCGKVLAQEIPSIPLGTLEPEQVNPSSLPETLPTLNTSPLVVPMRSPEPVQPTLNEQTKIRIKKVEVNGSTVFSQEQLAKAVASFVGQELTYEQLLVIRTAINQLYVSNGYQTSGSFLPPQDINNGVIQVQVVEGELERIDIEGLKRLRPNYVRSRIRQAAFAPLNIHRLEAALQLLQNDPLLSRVEAELTAGSEPGKSVLVVKLQERSPFNAALVIDNREVPSVGSIGGTLAISDNDLLGFGDRLSLEAGITGGVNSYNASYVVPINPRNGTIGFRYSNGRNRVTEQPFAPLEITGRAQTYALDFRQPIILTPRVELALGLSAQLRRSRTFLFDSEPFSFTEGPEDGASKVSVLRFNTDWVNRRNPNTLLAASSTFSLGLGVFDATTNDTGTDGRFLSWLGQFQYVRALNSQRDAVVVGCVAAQLTGDSLLPLEQFSIGGIDTVRGYRTNQRVGDNGITGSVELRLPIVRDQGFGLIQLVPFIDGGTIWSNSNNQVASADGTLLSTGLGLRFQSGNSFSARLDWGIPLISTKRLGNSLQDNGISFSVRVESF